MNSAEIRSAFLDYFQRNGHAVQASASLVPVDDPTLLFTNAGMVPFKKVFLGAAEPPGGSRRAASSQKCVRAGGKHNDLEQVGHTARHHTFFEMLGNFSFGDYFKREAIHFAWEFLTAVLKLDPKHLRVSVHHTDDEARALWAEIAKLPPSRIYGLGDKDNFWQMADTGPCGPCSEIYVDLAHVADDWAFPAGATGEWTELDRKEFSEDAFVEGAEAGRFLEIWNLVFMQYDRQADGTLVPLPRPSVDTGMGLERVAAALQRKTNNFHADLFAPIIDAVSKETGVQYDPRGDTFELAATASSGGDSRSRGSYASHRVIADHARSVAFLLADGVFPSNEGRGYVLRRILRRAVRNAWLLGVNRPVLHAAVEAVIASMGGAYPELRQRHKHIVDTTRAEEERFLATIEGGMRRFEEIAPRSTTQGSTAIKGTISGEDAFRLYDTFGFPIDLTQLMAAERGYTVDIAGFERSLGVQRTQSQQERKSKKIAVASVEDLTEGWEVSRPPIQFGARTAEYEVADAPAIPTSPKREADSESRAARSGSAVLPASTFVGYDTIEVTTEVVARKTFADGRSALVLRETPFYAESGGQISDAGEVIGDGWRLEVDEVRRVEGKIAVAGKLEGEFQFGAVTARVPRGIRLDTERNHTATHLLHAALREVLGEHVHQAGSLVAPDRLRFDFTNNGPMKPDQTVLVERLVNKAIFAATPLTFEEKRYADAIAEGAMALFGEKYGDVVKVVKVPGVSTELCGGTHVRNTSEIGLFRIASETGVAAGVRRIEAVTGPLAFEMMLEKERALGEIEQLVRAQPGAAVKRVQMLIVKNKESERQVAEARRSGGAIGTAASTNGSAALIEASETIDGVRVIASTVDASDLKSLQAIGDSLREEMGTGAAVLIATLDDGKHTLLAVVSDDLRGRGVRADNVLKEIAAAAGGRGGGKPHMAQAGLPESTDIPALLATVPEVIRRHLAASP
ncbi:MAG: alanine--tRNA ligase [Gemmatimonadaceae bacterium]|nr:alanine--tRNA ligase [Gemmatimonadaceae bacterium]